MRQRPRSAILLATLAAALTSACGAAAPPPSEPVAPAEPGPAPVADGREPAPDPTPPPDPEPTLVGEPVVPPSKAPDPNAPAEQQLRDLRAVRDDLERRTQGRRAATQRLQSEPLRPEYALRVHVSSRLFLRRNV